MKPTDIDWETVLSALHGAVRVETLRDPQHRRWVAGNTHTHSYPECIICLAGEHGYVADGLRIPLQPGTLIILPPHCPHDSGYGPYHSACIDLWIHLLPKQGSMTLNIIEHDPAGATTPWPLPMPEIDILHECSRAIDLISAGTAKAKTAPEARFFMLYLAARICRTLARSDLERTAGDQQRVLNHIKAYISDHFCDDLHLNDLAKVTGYSPFHLHRIFHATEGATLRRFVEDKRLQQAKRLLRDGRNITTAAIDSGFASSAQFARVFKRRMRMTASAWLAAQELHIQRNI